MGQKPSHHQAPNSPKLPLSWILRNAHHHHNPNPQQPIKFQYKTKRKPANRSNNLQLLNNNIYNVKNTNLTEVSKCKIVKTQNTSVPQYEKRTKSEPSLAPFAKSEERSRERHRHRKQQKNRSEWQDLVYEEEEEDVPQFGYEIQDVEAFLAKVRGSSRL